MRSCWRRGTVGALRWCAWMVRTVDWRNECGFRPSIRMSVRSSVMRSSAVRPAPGGSETSSSEGPAPGASLVAGSAARRPASSANARVWLASQLHRSSAARLAGRRNEISSSGMPPEYRRSKATRRWVATAICSAPEIPGGALRAWSTVRRHSLERTSPAPQTCRRRAQAIASDRAADCGGPSGGRERLIARVAHKCCCIRLRSLGS